MKTRNTLLISFLAIALIFSGHGFAQRLITFETLGMQTDTFFNGKNNPGGFTIDGVKFRNKFEVVQGFESWSGFAISTMRDTTTAGFTNQYSSRAGSGVNNSRTYAVGYIDYLTGRSNIVFNSRKQVNTLYINNSTYAYLSMKNGDAVAKKFGGSTGNDPDFFLLEIEAYRNGQVSQTKELYLADYRFANNANDYIQKEWQMLDFEGIEADSLLFKLSSSDNGSFGMNTPAYFCIDQISLSDVGVSTKTKLADIGISVYPNPAKSHVNIKSSNRQNLDVTITNSLGQVVEVTVENAGIGTKRIATQHLAPGVYMLKIATETGTGIQKLVIE